MHANPKGGPSPENKLSPMKNTSSFKSFSPPSMAMPSDNSRPQASVHLRAKFSLTVQCFHEQGTKLFLSLDVQK